MGIASRLSTADGVGSLPQVARLTGSGRPPFPGLGVIWSGLLFLLLFAGCSRSEEPVSIAALRAENEPDQESWDVSMSITDAGQPFLQMQAVYMARYEREDSTYMVFSGSGSADGRVRVDLFDEVGDSSAVIFSNRLTYYEGDRRFVARGNVTVTTKKGDYLESEHLAWSESLGKVSTPGFVRYRSGGDIISGYEFEANDDLSDKKLKRVTATIHPKEE